jgi:hypothetical protein
MSALDSAGRLVNSIVAVILMFVMAILSFFITVFIVDAGAGFAGFEPSGDYVVLAASILAASAIVAGASPLGAISGVTE